MLKVVTVSLACGIAFCSSRAAQGGWLCHHLGGYSYASYSGPAAGTIGYGVSTYGVAPSGVGVSPYAFGVSPFGFGVNPYATGVSPFGFAVNPYATGVSPYPFGVNPYATGVSPFGFGVNPYAFGVSPFSSGITPSGLGWTDIISLIGRIASGLGQSGGGLNQFNGGGLNQFNGGGLNPFLGGTRPVIEVITHKGDPADSDLASRVKKLESDVTNVNSKLDQILAALQAKSK
jgi:hypothetical protein